MQDLLEHQAWVKALALRLVRDPHLAEDLAQETCVVALERPSGSVRTMRAWLATVLRNLVRERARVDGSRQWREESSAREEATASTLDMYAKVSAHQRVVETVNELPEHYREVLLLRYFEGLTPTAIATRISLPLSTVKTRLARGLAQMRERLDRASGGDGESWMQALAPLTASSVATLAPSALWTALGLRVLAALLVVLGGSWALWGALSQKELPAEGPATSPLELELAEVAPVAPANDDEESSQNEREAQPVAREEVDLVATAAPTDYPLRGRVQDMQGRGLAGIVLSFEARRPAGKEAPTWIAVSSTDGEFTFEAVRGAGRIRALGEQVVTLFAAEIASDYSESEALVILAPAAPLAGRVVDEAGIGIPGAEVAVIPPKELLGTRDESRQGSALDLRFVESDETGAFDLGPAIDVPGARLQVQAEGYEPLDQERSSLSGSDLRLLLRSRTATSGDWIGRVETPEGAPLANARLSLGGLTTRSDQAGEFRFDSKADYLAGLEPAQLHGFHPDYGPATMAWTAQQPVLRLAPKALSIRGRVVDDGGRAVVGLDVYLADPTLFSYSSDNSGRLRRSGALGNDLLSRELRYELLEDLAAGHGGRGLRWTRQSTDEEGRFEVEGLVDRDYRLVLLRRGSADRRETRRIAAGSEGVELVFGDPPERVRVAGRLVDSSGRPVAGARVRSVCSAYPVHYQGLSLVTSTTFGFKAESGDDGRFDLGRMTLDSVYLEVGGNGVVPQIVGGLEEPLEDREARELGRLEIVVRRRLRLRLELLDPGEADRIVLHDADGEPVPLMLESPGRLRILDEAKLVDGQSDLMMVPDSVREVALWLEDQEVRRVPVTFVSKGVTVLRP